MRRCQCYSGCPRFITSRDPKAKYHPFCRAFAWQWRAHLKAVLAARKAA